jgi:hypothetical protein
MSKQDLEEQLIEIKKLAEEWREFSKSAYGWDCQTFDNGEIKVWCYFAESSDHTVVSFNSRLNNGIEIAFFNPAIYTFSDISISRLPDIIKNARTLLKSERQMFNSTEANELKKQKLDRAAILKKELAEIEGTSHD